MNIGFIGVGNMGGAIAKAISKENLHTLYLSNYNLKKAEKLKSECSNQVYIEENESIAKNCEIIFLGVKPHLVTTVLNELSSIASKDCLWISMAAGITISQLREAAYHDNCRLIRMMPNTPIEINQGMTTYAFDCLDQEGVKQFEDLMCATGIVLNLKEEKMDAATAVAGCGPAFIYQLIEAFCDAGVREGLTRDEVTLLATQMIKGATEMITKMQKHPGELKDAVTSPGGSTIEGIISLEKSGFRASIIEAVHAANQKNKQLSKIN